MKIHVLFFALILLPFILFAQKTNHVQGQIIVQLLDKESIKSFQRDFPILKNQPPEATKRLSGLLDNEPDLLVPPLSIFRFFFDTNEANEQTLLATIRRHPAVLNAQFNHYIESRLIPNDPQYVQEWHHNNSGTNNGVADADMDTEEAWNIATGGKTTDGDSIVVAIIDNGTSFIHPDLQQNLWVNRQEIPDNGIDDDRNGYIDDVRGWNAASRTDEVSNGTHGINIAGVIGAVGNNGRGIAGVNWAVKLMTIVYDGEEATVIASYGYALAQRKLYNQTRGRRGAFIVATNSSFGAPNKFPRDAPIWCAMYDSLGAVGILNVGATANANVDVDQVGDLPSTCPSDYLVVVTGSTNRDVKVVSAAFGQGSVDLAAPGENILTTASNADYSNQRGTSLACPMVAGLAALAYATPCTDFTNFAKGNPSGAALLLKDWILRGVEQKPDFMDKVKSGGRVNAFNTLQRIQQYCGACVQATRIQISPINAGVTVGFSAPPNATTVSVTIRKAGTQTNIATVSGRTSVSFQGLTACTDYELLLRTDCNGISSSLFSYFFRTDGCCSYPEDVVIASILQAETKVNLTKVNASIGYRVCLKESLTGLCVVDRVFLDTSFIIQNLKACQNYQMAISSVCANNQRSADTILNFRTKGCGACLDFPYCRSSGSTTTEWIDSLSVGNFRFFSGKNGGYFRSDSTITTLEAGKTYRISLKPGFSGFGFNQGARVWVDYNQDGDFADAGEQVIEFPRFNAAVSGSFVVPQTGLVNGITRLRVGMKYIGASAVLPTACENFSGGEVEDYCVRLDNLIGTDTILRGGDIRVFPNPFDNFLTIENKKAHSPILRMSLYAVDGRLVYLKTDLNIESTFLISDLPPLSKGVYILKLETSGGSFAAKLVR
jgi:hypothetical protein